MNQTHRKSKKNKGKVYALFGTVLMGISSFMACLGSNIIFVNIGTALLIISICISAYGFTYWRP